MKVALRQVRGVWDAGWVLDKHSVSSVYTGDDEFGRPRFHTTRTEVGEAAFQLKYRRDWTQAKLLAQTLAEQICPKFSNVGFVVPMPASSSRARQPVTEIARELGVLMKVPVFSNLLIKSKGGKPLKDLNTKTEKLKALGDSIGINDKILNEVSGNALLVDDLFHTGASMEAACKALRECRKVGKIYVAALTWKS